MKRIHKLLSGFMAFVMLLGILPAASFASQAASSPTSGATTSIKVTVQDAKEPTSKLAGAGIQLERVTSGRYENFGISYTDIAGTVTWNELESGWYRITQVTPPENYKENNAPIVRWIDAAESAHEITIADYAQNALTIKRMADGTTPINGAKFEVRTTDDILAAEGTTDETGTLYIPHIKPGTYTVREVYTPDGIEAISPAQNPQTLTVAQNNNDGNYSLLFNSSEQPSLLIYLLEKNTRSGVADATFTLKTTRNDVIQSGIRTDASGMAIVPDLAAGDYILSLTHLPDNYVQDLRSVEFTVRAGDGGNIIQTLYADRYSSLTITVADSQTGKPIPNASVSLYAQGNRLAAGPLTTAANGQVTFDNLEPGTYTAVVNSVPDGYTLDTSVQSVAVGSNAAVNRVFTATTQGSICIYCKDENGDPLSNCAFIVRKQSGEAVGTFTTDTAGYTIVPSLDNGYYIIEQQSAPEGYVIATATQTVQVTAGQMREITFICRTKPVVIVTGTVAGTAIPVPGAVYVIQSADGQITQTKTADSQGMVTFEDLTPGTYLVKCIHVPDGYTMISGTQTVVVSANKYGIADFIFEKDSCIIIKSLDSVKGAPLVGAVFQIRDENGTIIEQVTAGIDGVAVSKALPAGKYIVQELFPPEEYVADTGFQTVVVENNEPSLVTFTHSQKAVICIFATDRNALPLTGVQFVVCDGVTGTEIASLVTDAAGTATTSPLEPGAYTVKELSAPDGYLLMTSYQTPVVVYGDKPAHVRFPHAQQDTVLIETVDMTTRHAIGNARYSVTNLNGDLIGNYTAGSDGTVEVGPLVSGDYIVKQIVAPDGYKICTESQTIRVVSGRILNLRFANYKLTGLAIEAVTQGTHQGLSDITFEVYDAHNKQVFHGTTDATGYLVTDTLPAGTYTIKQMTTPSGYTAVETTKLVKVTYDDLTTAVFEQKAHTSLIIELVDAENKDALAGGRFKIQDINGAFITTAVTDEGGTAIIAGLPAGKYMVTQTEAPQGYILEGNYQWAELKTGVEASYVKFTNNRVSGLTIRAIDRSINAPLAAAVFDIYEENGKLVQTVTSDAAGITTVTNLKPGTYIVKEVKAPDGYQMDTPSQKATITNNASSTLTFNHIPNATVTLKAVSKKTGSVLAGVTFQVRKVNGDYVGEYTTAENGLVIIPAVAPGDYIVNVLSVPDGYLLDTTACTIEVKANSKVVEAFPIDSESGLSVRVVEAQTGAGVKNAEYKITTLDGTLVGTYVSNNMGYFTADLQPGKYILYQTYGPKDYAIDSRPCTIEVKANELTKMELELEKISHIRLQVIDSATSRGIYDVDVEILDYANNYIGRYRTDNDGYIYLDKILTSGRYKLNMLSVPAGYIKDSMTKTASVELNETTDIKWPISGKQGQLTITTLSDADNTLMGIYKGSRLSGAVYSITDMSGRTVATIYGDSYGEAHSGALSIGTYYVQQIQAPAGYMINDQRVTVRISDMNDNIKMTVYNKSGNFATTIESHGPKTVVAGQQAKFFWTNICNKSSISVRNFFIHIKVPTDGARAGTFFTGTYSGIASAYYIEYRTNYTDYRTLASGLNSKSQYSFDLSSLAMGLSSGEYVTDIRIVFPTASAGMHESMSPVLYISVLPNVINGYQLINRAEAGCQGASSASVSGSGSFYGSGTGFSANTGLNSLNDTWASSAAQSSTTVTQSQYPLPDTLPKTGY